MTARCHLAVAGWLLAACFALPEPAAARQQRFALVVGTNQGQPDEPRLRFAERDAERMSDVLSRLGNVAPEDLILLRGANREGLERALDALRVRIRRAKAADSAVEPVLFVYYSGHAGPSQMHLRGTTLPFKHLENAVEAMEATVAVVVMDACYSGALTRKKGGVGAEPFEFDVTDRLQTRGLAVLSSSAAGEDAQESDRLRGGVFTHHLVSGLMGAADKSRDGLVTLSEAWSYAQTQTVRTTSRSRRVQHPTFRFELAGRRELVITRLNAGATLATLVFVRPGGYVVFEDDSNGPVAMELAAREGTTLRLPPGRYRVRRRGARSVQEATYDLHAGKTRRAHDMKDVPYGLTIRKGLTAGRSVLVGLQLSGEVGGPLLSGQTPLAGLALGVQLDFRPVAVFARLRWHRSTSDNASLAMTQDGLGADLGIVKVFDIPSAPLGIGLGLRAGGDQLWQRFDTAGSAPTRSQWAWRFGPFLRFEFPIHARVGLVLDAGADIHFIDRLDHTTGLSAIEARVVPFGALGFTFWLP